MEVYFIVAHIDGGSKKFKLNNDEYVVVGRSKTGSQVILEDSMCSNQHCKIFIENNIVVVEDLKSKNGIFLNGVRVISQTLYIGDKLKVGNNILYILEDKLSEEAKVKLSYKGKGSRKSGDITFEVNAPNITSRDLGRQSRSSTASSTSTGRKKVVPVDFNPSRHISKSKMQLLDLAAYLIDLGLAITIFIMGIKSFAFFFKADYELLEKKNSLLKIMFSKELSTYTAIVFVLAAIFFFINRKKLNGSVGERILKIN